jgi:hypothetical protein
MLTTYKEYLSQKLLPSYFTSEDSYKDSNGKGFLQRFLEIFGEELDDYSDEAINELESLANPLLLSDIEFLNYKAFRSGDLNLTSLLLSTGEYQNLLTYIFTIYKVKGTKKSYEALLALLNITEVSFQRYPTPDIRYDVEGINYDDNQVRYDDSICITCFEYDLIITGTESISSLFYSNVIKLVKLVEPINAKLIKIIYNGTELSEAPITVYVDENGDLVYDNTNDPGLILSLDDNGNLIISGPSEDNYFVDDQGNLIYIND